MQTLQQQLTKSNKDLKYYEVIILDGKGGAPIMCEDGDYRVRNGYAVRNIQTEVLEHTTTLLPGAIFQAQHLDSTLDSLLNPKEQDYPGLHGMVTEDVVAN